MRRFLAILFCVALAACSPPAGPEQAVRNWLGDAQAAVEKEDRDALIDMISENYADARGNDRQAIDRRLRIYFLRNRNIVLASNIEELIVIGETAANVVLTAAMAGRNGGALPFGADAYRFELELVQDGGRWRLIGARWARPGEEPH